MGIRKTLALLIIAFMGTVLALASASSADETQYELITNVNISPAGMVMPDCSNGCSYDAGTEVQLLAVASAWYLFYGWGGDCAGTSPSTAVSMTAARSCTANFLPCSDLPVRICGVSYASIGEAYEDAKNNNVDTIIEVLGTNLPDGLTLDGSVSVTLKGGYICGFDAAPPPFPNPTNPSMSLIQGQVIITGENVTVENLIIASLPIVPPAPDESSLPRCIDKDSGGQLFQLAMGHTNSLPSAGYLFTIPANGTCYFKILATPPSGSAPVTVFMDNANQGSESNSDLLVKYAGDNCQEGWPTLANWWDAKSSPTPMWNSFMWDPPPFAPNFYYKIPKSGSSNYVQAYDNPNPYGCFYLMVVNNTGSPNDLVIVPSW